MASLTLVQTPALEPLTLAEARRHLRVDHTDDDDDITSMIVAAREAAETITHRSLVTQRWRLVLDRFPGRDCVQLHQPPVRVVHGIRYLDMGGEWQDADLSVFALDLDAEPGRIRPQFGRIWPITRPQIGAVAIEYTAGYGAPVLDSNGAPALDAAGNYAGWSPAAVPEGIRRWMRQRIGSLYEHREEDAVLTRASIAPLPFVDRLLDRYRVEL